MLFRKLFSRPSNAVFSPSEKSTKHAIPQDSSIRALYTGVNNVAGLIFAWSARIISSISTRASACRPRQVAIHFRFSTQAGLQN